MTDSLELVSSPSEDGDDSRSCSSEPSATVSVLAPRSRPEPAEAPRLRLSSLAESIAKTTLANPAAQTFGVKTLLNENIAALGMASRTIEAMGRTSALPKPAVLQIADLTKGWSNPLQQISAELAEQNKQMKAAAAGALSMIGTVNAAVAPALELAASFNSTLSQFQSSSALLGIEKNLSALSQLRQPSIVQHLSVVPKGFSAVAEMIGATQRAPLLTPWASVPHPLIQMPPAWVMDNSKFLAGFAQQASQMISAVTASADWMRRSLGALQEMGALLTRGAVALGNRIYFAVRAAQNAAARGDVEAVEAFFLEWLDLPRSKWRDRVEAGATVLIETRLENFGPDTAFTLLTELEKEINHYFRRGWRPLVDTKINHQHVLSLEGLANRVGGPTMSREDFLPGSSSAEDRALVVLNQFEHPWLVELLSSLDSTEVAVVWAWEMTGVSWQAAAEMCGLPAAVGERIRAKVSRRVKRILAAQAARAGSSTPTLRRSA